MKELGLDGSSLQGLVSGPAADTAGVESLREGAPGSADSVVADQRDAKRAHAGNGKGKGEEVAPAE